jgi:hypothetical protein
MGLNAEISSKAAFRCRRKKKILFVADIRGLYNKRPPETGGLKWLGNFTLKRMAVR